MNEKFELNPDSSIHQEYSNLFGISLRSARRKQQIKELEEKAEEMGISKRELVKQLKQEVSTTKGDKSKALGNLFSKLAAPLMQKEDAPQIEIEKEEQKNQPDSQIKILGMKPLQLGLVILGITVLGVGITVIVNNIKSN